MSKYKEFLETALTKEAYMDSVKKEPSKKHLIKTKEQKYPVPKDLYESGKDEKQVRKECNTWLKKQGWKVRTIYTGGIPIGNGLATNPAKGCPDTIIFKLDVCVWIEYKRTEGATTTDMQIEWKQDLKKAGQKVLTISSLTSLKKELQ